MSTPPSKFFNRYEFDEDVRDERDRLRAINELLLAAAQLTVLMFKRQALDPNNFHGDDEHEAWTALNSAIAEAQKATGTQP